MKEEIGKTSYKVACKYMRSKNETIIYRGSKKCGILKYSISVILIIFYLF